MVDDLSVKNGIGKEEFQHEVRESMGLEYLREGVLMVS